MAISLRTLHSKLTLFTVAIAIASSATPSGSAQSAVGQADPTSSTGGSSSLLDQRVDQLIQQMTLEEKVSQMQNHSVAIPRLGVPAYDWWSEGLHGIARSGYATLFPQAIGLAATWDTTLQHQVADTISIEARAKYNEAVRHNIHDIYFGLTIWSPNINIFRDPRWGRGQETYGEDPYLTGRLGVAFVTGLQGDDPAYPRVVATPKHFAVHSGPESDRHRFNVNVSPHDLQDTYLPAFRATITEAHAQSLMCAYNAVDGAPACANAHLLNDILRHNWHFDGFITSDCGAVSDIADGHKFTPDIEHAAVVSLRAGTDTSCGDEYSTLTRAVHDNLIKESELDVSLRRLFHARFSLGMFDPAPNPSYAAIPFSEVDSAKHREIALQTARESMVLLKNQDSFLPFKSSIRKIAVIGPNASSLAALEGNYNAVPSHPVLPIDGLRSVLGGRVAVQYAQGSVYVDGMPIPVPPSVFTDSEGRPGLHAEYFDTASFSGKPVLERTDSQIQFDWNAASPAAGVPADHFGVRWTGSITAPAPGEYTFNTSLSHCYPCNDFESYTVYLDGKSLAHEVGDGRQTRGEINAPFTVHFADTRPHNFRVEYTHASPLFGAGITLNWQPPATALREEAVAAARNADAVVAFVGLSPDLEGEEMPVKLQGFRGGDRSDIELPAAQQQMLEAVSATGKPLVVVLLNGSALAVNWAQQHAAAILEAWYPGEEGGTAIAETLLGTNNPAGRLPVTFYKSATQLPAFDEYSMQNRTYRYFKGTPLYPFGFGLSYTGFKYSQVKLSTATVAAGDPLTVSATVSNVGAVAGDEVVELFLTTPPSGSAPIRSLVGFERIHLSPGESKPVSLNVAPRQLSVVDATGKRSIVQGQYAIHIGGSQPDATDAGTSFAITGSTTLPE
jgi:beta-glucosidase